MHKMVVISQNTAIDKADDNDPHHIGLFLITAAFVVLLIYVLNGFALKVPSAFFILYGLGGLVLMSHMRRMPFVAVMEFVGAAISLFVGVKLYFASHKF